MRGWRWVAIASTCVAGCGGAEEPDGSAPREPQPALAVADPGAPGPYAVGVTHFEIADDGSGRALPVEVWYPATPAPGSPPATYAFQLGALTLAEAPSPRGAVRDAPLDLRGAPHATVVFSHGNLGVRFQSVYLTEWLASHGFVVAAPDHVGNTFHEGVDQGSALPAAETARVRPLDVSRTLDALLARSADPADPLSLAVDAARVGVAGHSFGAFTALRIAGATMDVDAVKAGCAATPDDFFCDGWDELRGPYPASQRDPRFLVALPQAPGGAAVFGASGFGAIAAPTMIQGGSVDRTMPFEQESQPAYDAITRDAYLLEVDRAGHFTFSDMCLLLKLVPDVAKVAGDVFDDGCGTDNVDPDEAHAVIDRYATAFFQARLAGAGDAHGVLQPAEPLPEDVARFDRKP